MLIRFIFWMILSFIAAKLIGQFIRYIRQLFIPNQHIQDTSKQQVKKYSNVEDVPYEEISDKK
jgi:hypothetical protein